MKQHILQNETKERSYTKRQRKILNKEIWVGRETQTFYFQQVNY